MELHSPTKAPEKEKNFIMAIRRLEKSSETCGNKYAQKWYTTDLQKAKQQLNIYTEQSSKLDESVSRSNENERTKTVHTDNTEPDGWTKVVKKTIGGYNKKWLMEKAAKAASQTRKYVRATQ